MSALTVLIAVFFGIYALILFEEKTGIDKTPLGLILAALCWVIAKQINPEMLHYIHEDLAEVTNLVMFLIVAMAIVGMIEAHNGFQVIARLIAKTAKNPIQLLWIISGVSFVLGGLINNLPAMLVGLGIASEMLYSSERRALIAGSIVLAANAGGACSPLAFTTFMLWTKKKVTVMALMKVCLIPSIVCFVVSTFIIMLLLRKEIKENGIGKQKTEEMESGPALGVGAPIMLIVGLLSIVGTPMFESITGLPALLGLACALGITWLTSSILVNTSKEDFGHHSKHTVKEHIVHFALSKIDLHSSVFIWAILLAVAVLGRVHVLADAASALNGVTQSPVIIAGAMGFGSALLDNNPLMAAVLSMYGTLPANAPIFLMCAFTAAVGGSMVHIGSAAGISMVSKENKTGGWYLKKISFPAFVGFMTGLILMAILT